MINEGTKAAVRKARKRNAKPHDLPDEHVIVDKRGYVYYYSKAYWDSGEKKSKDDRVSIGKICDPGARTFIPNKNYFELFPELDDAPKIGDALSIGPYLALRKAAAVTGLYQALERSFPDLAAKIFAIATYAICEESMVSYGYDAFAFSNFAGLGHSISSGSFADIYREIGVDYASRERFHRLYAASYEGWAPGGLADRRVVGFDSTNHGTSAEEMWMAEYGHAKKSRGLPIICSATFADELTGIPLWRETFPGSLLDKSQAPFEVEQSAELGLSKVFLMMDRGYFSEGAIGSLAGGGREFAISVPETARLAADCMDGSLGIKNSRKHYIEGMDAYGKRIDGVAYKGIGGLHVYVYFDPRTMLSETLRINSVISESKKSICRDNEYYSESLAERWSKYFRLVKKSPKAKKSRFTVEETAEVQRELDRAGMFAVVSNAEMEPSQMLRIIRCRDVPEKTFRRKKWAMDFDAPRVHYVETYEGKEFVAFVAEASAAALEWIAKGHLKKTSTKTLREAISRLKTVSVRKKPSGAWTLRYKLGKYQSDVFKDLDIKEKEIASTANKVLNV